MVKGATGPGAPTFEPLYHAIHHALYTEHPTWRDAYLAHDARVRAFFESEPGRLLIFDIFASGHGWPELSTFLGRGAPDASYPNLTWNRPQRPDPEQSMSGS